MLPIDGFLKALAAVVAASFGLILLIGARPVRRSHGWLSAFLVLISVNQAAEALRTTLVDPGTARQLYRIASIAASLDPAALLLFAAALPRGGALARRGIVATTLACGGLLALYAGWGLGDPSNRGAPLLFAVALAGYTFAIYAVVLVWALRGVARGDGELPWRPLSLGLAAATVPSALRLLDNALLLTVRPAWGWDPGSREPASYWTVVVAAEACAIGFLAIATYLVARRAWSARKKGAMLAALATGLALLLFTLPNLGILVAASGGSSWIDLSTLGRSSAALRWLAFGIALSLVVCRDDGLRMSRSARRWTARGLVVIGVLVATGVAFTVVAAVFGSPATQTPLVVWMGLLAAVGLSQGSRSFIDTVVLRVYGLSAEPALRPSEGPLLVGRMISGRYRLVALLGRGGSGRAFLARDERLQRNVVVKEVQGVGPAAIEEARLAGKISHGNVLTVHDVLLRGESTILITEHAAGEASRTGSRARARSLSTRASA